MGPPDQNGDNGGDDDHRPHGMSLDSRVHLVSYRIKHLTNEVKELKAQLAADQRALIERLGKLEVTYQRVFGIVLVFPILGAILGFIATYWSSLFRPWTR